ncbi:MAG: hypothetical protein ACI9VN_000817 [Patescibacteria group bacterium]|jgi:hypothetical protein
MKKFYFLFFAALFASMAVNAQLIDENFDGYTLGDMNDQNPDVWGVWSGSNNGGESIGVSNAFAASGTQSGFIGAGPGPQDAILRMGNIEENGTYELSFNMYIPAGKTGYFNLQGETTNSGGAGGGGAGVFNSSNLVFNNTDSANGMAGLGGAYGNVDDADPTYSWDYPEDSWFLVHILFVISDDSDSTGWTMSINDVELEKQDYAADGIIGGIDFFGINANNEYYVDDILFDEVIMINTENPVLRSMKVYPNPVADMLTIETTEQVDEITIYNLLGSPVLNTTPNVLSPVLDMSSFSAGLYMVEVKIGDDTRTIKVTK